MPTSRSFWFVPTLLSMAVIAGCDNVGAAFDRPGNNEPPPVGAASIIEVIPVGGEVRDARPTVRATYPEGAGWPLAVPVVVEFSESVNQASILPTTPDGSDGRVVLRVRGANQVVPCLYDFLVAGRLLMLRPLTALSNNQNPTYEVVLLPDARDADGVRFMVPAGGTVLSEFQVNQDAAITDGRILATFPRENQRDVTRESPVLVVFDRRPNPTTLLPTNLFVRTDAGAPVAGELGVPLATVGIPDPRVVQFTPAAGLAADQSYELVVNDLITFGSDGRLDFRGRTPFARFDTIGPAAPLSVTLRDSAIAVNKINIDRVANPQLRVRTPPDTRAGDRVRVRIYGGDAETTASGDLGFVERSSEALVDGEQDVDVPFTAAIGTLARPKFDDGSLTFAAQLQRGSQRSGFMQAPSTGADAPRFDIIRPRLVRAGPPGSANGLDLFSDLEYVAFYGIASEPLAEVRLDTLNGQLQPASAMMFACDDAGRFVMRPLAIGREFGPRPYTMLLTDLAGNLSESIAGGSFRQRGFVTGTLTDTLVVEAYDQVTLAPVAGATVLVDVGVVTSPPTAQLVDLTGADGRVQFATTPGSHTITIVRTGYDLITLDDTRAALVSLPLRPVASAAATATLATRLEFDTVAGSVAVASTTADDGRRPVGEATISAAPRTVPDVAIVPNRPHVVSALATAGLEPTARPTFFAQGCSLGGVDLVTPTPPAAPVEPGARSPQTVTLRPGLAVGQLVTPLTLDFSASGVALGTTLPTVRVTLSLEGFEGQALAGLGFATGTGIFSVDADYARGVLATLASFAPVAWLLTEARDASGRIARNRGLLQPEFGTVGSAIVPVVPVILAPTGPFSGSPLVEFDDRLDQTVGPPFFGAAEITARGPSGRRWVVLRIDRDAASGTDLVQFPDLANAGGAGLGGGTWVVQVEQRTWTSVAQSTADDLMLTERVRQEINYARSAPVDFVVQ